MKASHDRILTSLPPGTLWFGGLFSRSSASRGLCFEDPLECLSLTSSEETDAYFSLLQERLEEGYALAGYVGYEAGYGFEPTAFNPVEELTRDELPLAWFGVYHAPRECDFGEINPSHTSGCAPGFDMTLDAYRTKIEMILDRIAAGDVYQVNFTGRYSFDFDGPPDTLFHALSARQPQSYRAWLNIDGHQIMSFSPELFFSRKGRCIHTCPMKGTAPRGKSVEEDEELREGLRHSEKNRAENLMIVDLLRNDLGRICTPGSVTVPELFTIRSYPTLHQMVSSVDGELEGECDLRGLFRAIFPCGSVTGAPKIRAMQLIRQLEQSPRGVYTGAVGFMLPDMTMEFNVAIRTLTLNQGHGTYGAGSGIVWDSDADDEFGECGLKAGILLDHSPETLSLFETLLWNGSYLWLEDHLDRLRRSAETLGFSCSRKAIRSKLDAYASARLQRQGTSRVRVVLERDGRFSVSSEPLGREAFLSPVKVCFAAPFTDSKDPMLGHKTTARHLYDRILRQAAAAGFDEVLFCNERGEITEGAISNVIIMKDGRYYTPPLSCGMLPGIYRSYFLATRSNAVEKVLYPEDLLSADAVFVCNSLRAMRRSILFPSMLIGDECAAAVDDHMK